MAEKLYRALKPFVHRYIHCDAGATIKLSDEQAEFLRHGGFIAPDGPTDESPATTADSQASVVSEPDAHGVETRRRKGGRA